MVQSYDFKTEELHLDLMAAVNNMQKIDNDKNIKETLGSSHLKRTIPARINYDKLAPYMLYRSKQVISKMLENTTQLAKAIVHSPMRRHLKSRFLMLRHKHLNEVIATDTYFANTRSIEGYWCAQVFVGLTSRRITVIGMKTESEFTDAYQDFMRSRGIPHTLRRDNAKSETSKDVLELQQKYAVADKYTEPYSPWQNPAEGGGVRFLKAHAEVLMNRFGCPDNL